MNDEQLLRYSRHILLAQLDIDGQQKLLDSHVVIVGLGGLGSPVSMYLAAAGIGRLTLVDSDSVEISNLQRQIVHSEVTLGQTKVDSAAQRLLSLNHEVEVIRKPEQIDHSNADTIIADADLIVDCSDNFATRFLLNEISQKHKKPLISGAAIRLEGQVTVYDPRVTGSACYRCLYEDTGELEQTCSESGILAPVLAIIGGVQAVEAIKLLAGFGESLSGRLLILDAFSMSWREIRLKPDPNCPVCSGGMR